MYVDTQYFVIGQDLADQKGSVGSGPQNVNMLLNDLPLTEVGVFLFDHAVGVSRGETLIVQNPDLHIPLLTLRQDDVHIRPPVGAAKIGMGAGFYAKGTATAVIDALHLSRNAIAVGSVLPIEGQQVIILFAENNVTEFRIRHKYLLRDHRLLHRKSSENDVA